MPLIQRTRQNQRGAIAVLVALTLFPMILLIGAVTDFARAYVVRDQLLSALDSTALAIAAEADEDKSYLRDRADEFFASNYEPSADAPADGPEMTINDSSVTVEASADVDTLFLRLAGIEEIPLTEKAKAIRRSRGLEVVLVLDITGSMAYGGNMSAMRDAAEDLVRTLFGNKETPDNLRVSVVPFATAVNVGENRTDLLTNYDADAFTDYGTDWKGCVEARDHPHDVQDTDAWKGGGWEPYRWPKEPPYNACTNPAENPAMKDYDYVDETPAKTMGPNKGCGQPIMSFTNDKSELVDKIRNLEAWNHGGTEAHLGMAWGMRMLSPREPFTDTKPYSDDEWNKAIIVLTDGNNQLWLGDTDSACSSSFGGPEGPYTPYGYVLSNDRLGIDDDDGGRSYRNQLINERFDDRMLDVCDNIKKRGSGNNKAEIFTITFKVGNSDTKDLFRNCATSQDNYYNSPSNQELKNTFRAIGAELQNLRLAR